MNVLFLVNELQNTCGITKYLYNIIAGLKTEKGMFFTIVCGGGDAIEKFRDLNVEVICNRNFHHQSRNYWRFLRAHMDLLKILRKKEIEIVHSHHHYCANISFNISKIFRIRTILTNHGIIPENGRLNHFSAEHIVAVNEHIVDYVILNKIKDASHVHLIRFGLYDCDKIKKTEESDKIQFLAASRIVYEKGLDIFTNAVYYLPRTYWAKASFCFAGRGDYLDEVLKLIKKLNVPVKYLGNIDNLQERLFQNDVFIMPTRSNAEGFPVTLIEAAAAKNIIITSDFNGVYSIFENEKDGWLFNSEDPLSLATRIKTVIDDFSRSKTLAENFNRKIMKLYSYEEMTSSHIKLYNSLMSQTSKF